MANIIKYMLFATNFLVFIMGCVVLGIGIFAIVNGAALMDLVDEANSAAGTDLSLSVFTSAAIILIVVSVFVVIVAFFGCCGAIKESKCMLGTYFTIILVMFIILIVGAVIGYQASFDEIGDQLDNTMKSLWIKVNRMMILRRKIWLSQRPGTQFRKITHVVVVISIAHLIHG